MPHGEVLSLLDEVLAGDPEIVDGVRRAEVPVADLRASAERRLDEIAAACAPEDNRVSELEREVARSEAAASRLLDDPPWPWQAAIWLYWAIIAGTIAAYLFTWIIWGGFHNRVLGYLWTGPGPGGLPWAIGLVVLAAALWTTMLRLAARERERALNGVEHRILLDQLAAARHDRTAAIRDRGLKSILREEINLRLPRYGLTLEIGRADGLSELRNPVRYVPSAVHDEIVQLIGSMPGGSIGVSGPRGAGKSTVLRQFCATDQPAGSGQRSGAVRILLAAPVRYDAREFVLHLFTTLCTTIGGVPPSFPDRDSSAINRRFLRQLALAALSLTTAWGVVTVLSVARGWKLNPNLPLGIFLVGFSLLATFAVSRRYGPGGTDPGIGPEAKIGLEATARTLLGGLRYQQSVAQGWSAGMKLPVGLETAMSSNTTMTERPMSFPEIVDRLGQFLQRVAQDRQVFIGIDELDKIESAGEAYEFLNDIKAIFGVRGCFYLVTISENAMSAFERRGLPLRDAFDSAFDTVVEVPYLRYGQSRRLVLSRVIGMPEPFIALAHVMAGGLPRDLIRAARELVRLSETSHRDLAVIATALTTSDAARKTTAARFAVRDLTDDVSAEVIGGALPGVPLLTADAWSGLRAVAAPATGKAARIGFEAVAYAYFCATVRDYFAAFESIRSWPSSTTVRTPEQLRDLADDADALAACRQAFTVGPQAAWAAVEAFRMDHALPEWPLNGKE
jgi:hypothetical protein